jgi:hypothetical protein
MRKLLVILIVLLCVSLGYGDGRYIYVDCDGGDDDTKAGTTADPLLGITGLQRAIRQDASGGVAGLGAANTDSNDIIIYVRDTLTVNNGIEDDANDSTVPAWKRLIGCTGSGTTWTPVSRGAYVNFNAIGTDLGEAILKVGSGGNVNRRQVYGISFRNNNSNGGTPGVGEDGILLTASAVVREFSIDNCDFTDIDKAINATDTDVYYIFVHDCNMTLIDNIGIDTSRAIAVDGLYMSLDSGINGITLIANSVFMNVTAVGGARAGNSGASASGLFFSKCSFYNQTTACIATTNQSYNNIFIDCIFYVADPTADYALNLSNGTVFVRNCITNCDTRALAGFWANSLNGGGYNMDNSYYDLDFTNTDPWQNASGNDFRYGTGTIATTYVKDKGYRMYGDGTANNRGYGSVGSWQATQVQGAGGGGQSVLGGGVVR